MEKAIRVHVWTVRGARVSRVIVGGSFAVLRIRVFTHSVYICGTTAYLRVGSWNCSRGVKRQEGFVRMGKRGSSRRGQNFTVVKF